MTDPSGLRVIEALCPSVSRYTMEMRAGRRAALGVDWWPPMARMGFDAASQLSEEERVAEYLRQSLESAITEMRSYEPAAYCDHTGWHKVV